MTTLLESAINLVAQFIRIGLKILTSYLQDQAKPFLNNVGVKKPKTKYNNEELASKIRCYVFKNIQTLDMILVDLE